jgi:hypothetical protein
LAREFLPDVPLPDVVDLACRFANAGTLPGARIALYGDTMVNFSKSPESALAQTISHIRKLVGTCLHNVQTAQDEMATGRLERIVVGERRARADLGFAPKRTWRTCHNVHYSYF